MSIRDTTPPTEEVLARTAPSSQLRELAGRDVPITTTSLVNRTLPHRDLPMIGAWCFADHYGPDAVRTTPGMRVPPHPHRGLQTVSWLFDGEIEHRDSLGTVQIIAPGELNLMTAGRGIAHSEQSPVDRPPYLHGVQLWIALPDAARDTAPRFDNVRPPVGRADGLTVTVLLGSVLGLRSPARAHAPIVGAEVGVDGSGRLPLEVGWEHGVLPVGGTVRVEDREVQPGRLVYLGTGRRTVDLAGQGTVMLLGGPPFEEQIVMWWNFVCRSHDEVVAAREAWMTALSTGDSMFGTVAGYDGAPLPAPAVPGVRLRPRGGSAH